MDATLTVTLNLTSRTLTRPRLLLQLLPHIKGTCETTTRILQPYNIRVAHKPLTALQQQPTNVKDRDESSDRQGEVYKIKCCNYQATDIGETGRILHIRLSEHCEHKRRATRNDDIKYNLSGILAKSGRDQK